MVVVVMVEASHITALTGNGGSVDLVGLLPSVAAAGAGADSDPANLFFPLSPFFFSVLESRGGGGSRRRFSDRRAGNQRCFVRISLRRAK